MGFNDDLPAGNNDHIKINLAKGLGKISEEDKEKIRISEEIDNMSDFRTATLEEMDEIRKVFSEWYNVAPNMDMFSSSMGCAKSAIMEYIANTKGLSIFKMKQGG